MSSFAGSHEASRDGPQTIASDTTAARYQELELHQAKGLSPWTIATHDILYKANDVSWRRDRIAHQTKAALEQAEVAIESMSALESTAALPEGDETYLRHNRVIELLHAHWPPDQLPADVRRLGQAVSNLLRVLNLEDTDLEDLLVAGRAKYGGSHNLDWSPYQAVIQYAAEQHPAPLKWFLANPQRSTLFVYPSVLAELGLDPAQTKSATFLP